MKPTSVFHCPVERDKERSRWFNKSSTKESSADWLHHWPSCKINELSSNKKMQLLGKEINCRSSIPTPISPATCHERRKLYKGKFDMSILLTMAHRRAQSKGKGWRHSNGCTGVVKVRRADPLTSWSLSPKGGWIRTPEPWKASIKNQFRAKKCLVKVASQSIIAKSFSDQ